jgi:hypothetical protein
MGDGGVNDGAPSLAIEDSLAAAGTIEKGGNGMLISEPVGSFMTGLEEATGEAAIADESVDDATGCCSRVGEGLMAFEGDASTLGV